MAKGQGLALSTLGRQGSARRSRRSRPCTPTVAGTRQEPHPVLVGPSRSWWQGEMLQRLLETKNANRACVPRVTR